MELYVKSARRRYRSAPVTSQRRTKNESAKPWAYPEYQGGRLPANLKRYGNQIALGVRTAIRWRPAAILLARSRNSGSWRQPIPAQVFEAEPRESHRVIAPGSVDDAHRDAISIVDAGRRPGGGDLAIPELETLLQPSGCECRTGSRHTEGSWPRPNAHLPNRRSAQPLAGGQPATRMLRQALTIEYPASHQHAALGKRLDRRSDRDTSSIAAGDGGRRDDRRQGDRCDDVGDRRDRPHPRPRTPR